MKNLCIVVLVCNHCSRYSSTLSEKEGEKEEIAKLRFA